MACCSKEGWKKRNQRLPQAARRSENAVSVASPAAAAAASADKRLQPFISWVIPAHSISADSHAANFASSHLLLNVVRFASCIAALVRPSTSRNTGRKILDVTADTCFTNASCDAATRK